MCKRASGSYGTLDAHPTASRHYSLNPSHVVTLDRKTNANNPWKTRNLTDRASSLDGVICGVGVVQLVALFLADASDLCLSNERRASLIAASSAITISTYVHLVLASSVLGERRSVRRMVFN